VQIRVEIKNCTFRNPLGSVSEITGEYYENETHLNIITRVWARFVLCSWHSMWNACPESC